MLQYLVIYFLPVVPIIGMRNGRWPRSRDVKLHVTQALLFMLAAITVYVWFARGTSWSPFIVPAYIAIGLIFAVRAASGRPIAIPFVQTVADALF